MLSGQMGTYSQWKEEDAIANGSTVANIDGNAQYEATWNITGDGTGSIEFLILQISGSDSSSEDYKNFTADQYPDLKITVDEVYIDGVKAPYTSSADSIDYKYYEADLGKARIYLTSTWEQPKLCQDLSPQTEVKQQIKVVFTVSGLYNDGTSNVTNNSSGGNNTTPTQAPSENNNQPTRQITEITRLRKLRIIILLAVRQAALFWATQLRQLLLLQATQALQQQLQVLL